MSKQILSIIAHTAENTQQTDENIVQRYIKADGGTNIVCFPTIDDFAGFQQNRARRK